jgi:hypothetical protein
MSRFLAESASELLLAFAGCGLLIAVGAWAIGRCKQMVYNQAPPTNEMMSTFHELHEQGELSDEEYKNIKTRLAARMQHEVRVDPKD